MKIAIIGSGISGLSCAYLLNPHHQITLYEQNDYLGGHSRTLEVNVQGTQVPVDTGFIVFNKRNYPNLTHLFQHLNVNIAKSKMSFGVSINDGYLEYGTSNLLSLFAQGSNVMRMQYWKMVAEILRFNRLAIGFVERNPEASIEQMLDRLKFGDWFRQYYILAMAGAIWSTPVSHMLRFPAKTLVQFFDQHGLLTVKDQPQWYTVKGGSREYVKAIADGLDGNYRLNCGVKQVIRKESGVDITDQRDQTEHYDHVILACHSDQALAMLDQPSTTEQQILGNIHYQPNKVILHSDISFMPKRKRAWSSWVYLANDHSVDHPSIRLSYWMNNLQPLATDSPLIVTLNPSHKPDPALIHDECILHHPVFDLSAIKAQKRMAEIQGAGNVWYCGAWNRYGFHEDGLLSAISVAKQLGVKIPWE